jgi:hypothetical protein
VLIKAFCEGHGAPPRHGPLLRQARPADADVGSRPGNRYQVFDQAQVERARLIRPLRALACPSARSRRSAKPTTPGTSPVRTGPSCCDRDL